MRRFSHTILGGCVLAIAAAVGCYNGPSASNATSGETPTTEVAPTETTSGEIRADLPCDVAAVISSTCASCHGPVLAEEAKIHLTSRADLVKKSATDPSRSVAEVCLARMQDADKPMPPNAPASDAALAAFEAWIADGMPEGTCSPAGIDYETEVVCTSKKKWTSGDRGSKEMHPGRECISCHEQSDEREAENFTVAGTVFPTAHEPDECYGVNGSTTPTQVILTDAANKKYTLTVNAAGNFYTSAAVKFPIRAKVKKGDSVFEMGGLIKDGECNACHTKAGRSDEGDEYPRGRIVIP